MRLCLALSALVAASHAHAQSAADNAPRVERVEVEDVLHARPGRVAVNVTAHGGARITLGLAASPPLRAERDTRFFVDRAPIVCSSPCTLYLRPGVHQLVADGETAFPWGQSLDIRAHSSLSIAPHRVGLSALGGAMFILGLAAAVLGPAVAIANVAIGESFLRTEAIVIGSLVGAAGVGTFLGGYFVVQHAAPRLTLTPTSVLLRW